MTARERYYWDLVGHLVVPNVLTASEVAEANEALDYLDDRLQTGTDEASDLLREHAQPRWLDGKLVWADHTVPFLLMLPQPHCEPFRKMLAQPQIVRRLRAMCGEGFRLDGGPFFIGGTSGTEVHKLHGAGEPHKPYVAYTKQNGASFTGAVTVSYAFSDAGAREGGFACVPGSHKSRYPIPPGLRTMDDAMGGVENPAGKAGDAILIINGAQTHGAVPWKGATARRSILFMYAARSAARHGASRLCIDPATYWDKDTVSGMTAEQEAVMYGPSSSPQTDGPYLDLDEDGVVQVDRDFLPSLRTASDTFLQG